MRRVLGVILGVFMASLLMGQDIHFSQFYASPLNLNPALTGMMDREHRISVNYRSQWSSFLGKDAYNTISGSYDRQFASGRDDLIGAGLVLYGDKAGEASLSTVFGAFNGSYSKKIAGDRSQAHFLTGGVSFGFGQRSLNTSNLRWASQFRPNGSGDVPVIDSESATFLDLGGGLLWYSALSRHTRLYVGVSAAHLNEPEVNFLDNQPYNLNSRLTVHAGGEFRIVDQFYLLPFGLYLSQGDAKEINLGTAARFMFGPGRNPDQSFDIGIYARIVENYTGTTVDGITTSQDLESLIFMARLAFSDMSVGISYDYNVSDLSGVSRGNGALEVSIQYYINEGIRTGVNSPSF